MIRRLHVGDDWRFRREYGKSLIEARQPDFDDSEWRMLNVPHDWSIELDFNPESASTHEGGFLDGGIGWYRKAFVLPDWMSGKKLSIDFDGVYMNSTVYLNGMELGSYPYGYNAFTYDITDKVYGDGSIKVLAVRVENIQPSSRWYSGSGIYRNVYLTVTEKVHVERYGTFVTTPDLEEELKHNRARVNLKTKVNNDSGRQAAVTVKSVIYDAFGTKAAAVTSGEMMVEPGASGHFENDVVIADPKLWSTDEDNRYKLVTEVMADGQLTDVYETRFGLRYFSFDSEEGFSLNGRYMKLHGACMHHDLGALGAAVNERAVERQMQMMKEMGVNAIRVTHNPAAPELIEACNRLGLLVVEETFDTWNLSKKEYDYGRFFSQWAEHDTKEMVDRNKNEPSIIMWSIGNEIYDTTSPEGAEIVRSLVKWVKEIDPTRPTTIGEDKTRGDKVSVTPINAYIQEIFNEVDVVGLNYSENNYIGYREQHPEWRLYGSETSSATRSRGVYTHPYEYNLSTTYEDRQQSSYDNDYVAWGRTAEEAWKHDRDLKHIAGQFIWTGFDYIGEPTPYYNAFPAKSSYFGAVDTAGFPKDIYYYYQSQWNSKPMVHILPHWNWTAGDTVRVLVYTNARSAELLLTGKSLGERHFEVKTTSWGSDYQETAEGKTYLEWPVLYEEGALTALAKDEHGRVIGEAKVETAGAPAAVRLTADRLEIGADGRDLAFITAEVVDHNGILVPTADHLLEFSVSGAGVLVGVDNGDAASIERYKDHKRRSFSGKALAIVQSRTEPGKLVVQASSAGLSGSSVVIAAQASAQPPKLVSADPADYRKKVRMKNEPKTAVKTVLAVEQLSMAVLINRLPILPSTAAVYYSDGTVEQKEVKWADIPAEHLGAAGEYEIEGSIIGIQLKPVVRIRVTEEIGVMHNISRAKNGYEFPKAEASFTCQNPDSSDRIEAVHDDVISYGNQPENRWSNRAETPRPGDWITITFGDFEPVEHDVDEVEIHWYEDGSCSSAASLEVQYKAGDAWVNVHNLKNPLAAEGKCPDIYTFDPVRTTAVRIVMGARPGQAIGVTEIRIFDKQPQAYKEPKVTDIRLDGKSILGDCSPGTGSVHEYAVKLPSGAPAPSLTGTGSDNTAITVVPAVSAASPARLIARSEDGKKTAEYRVYC